MKISEVVGAIFEMALKIVILVIVGVFIYRGTLRAYGYGYRVFTEAPRSAGEGRVISVEIFENESASEIGKMLEDKGLIDDWKLFILQERLSGNHGDEIPGIYDLSTSMTAEEMISIMCGHVAEEETENVEEAVQETILPENESGQESGVMEEAVPNIP